MQDRVLIRSRQMRDKMIWWPLHSYRRMLKISKAAYGDHDIIIYDDLDDFRKIYRYHCKIAHEEKNEIVLICTTYESLDEVKDNLDKARIDVQKHMSEGS